MENFQKYLDSGILELYVCGALSEAESVEVTQMLKKYPELREEVEQIEDFYQDLSSSVAPYDTAFILQSIRSKISRRSIKKRNDRRNWYAITGWAASILLLLGLFFMYQVNQELKDDLANLQMEQELLKTQIIAARTDAAKADELLDALRSRNIEQIKLPGQEFAPEAYATAYWNRANQTTFIDAKELPEPPPGMVYQVWSLTLDPLTPSSIGLLEDFEENDKGIFILDNGYASEAFGITLEPSGGSASPTSERLVVLGTVATG